MFGLDIFRSRITSLSETIGRMIYIPRDTKSHALEG
jgi:hypothetical protein